MSKPNFKRPAPPVVKDSVFTYLSICCNAQANKPACAVAKGHVVGTYLGFAPKDAEATLGSWRCSTCRKSCKVTRVSKSKQESANV